MIAAHVIVAHVLVAHILDDVLWLLHGRLNGCAGVAARGCTYAGDAIENADAHGDVVAKKNRDDVNDAVTCEGSHLSPEFVTDETERDWNTVTITPERRSDDWDFDAENAA